MNHEQVRRICENAEEEYFRICGVVAQAVGRIREAYPDISSPWHPYYVLNGGFYKSATTTREEMQVYLTDRPKEVFAGINNLYHVTTSLALKSLLSGIPVLPYCWHESRKVSTLHGSDVPCLERIYRATKIDLGAKSLSVWAGPLVDNEQVFMKQMACDAEPLFSKDSASRPLKIVKILADHMVLGKKPKDDPILSDMVDEFMGQMFTKMHVRYNFYTWVRDGLLGREDETDGCIITRGLQLDGVKREVEKMHDNTDIYKGESQAVVLDIDFDKVCQRVLSETAYPLIVSSRSPQTIVPLPNIEITDLRGVYCWNEHLVESVDLTRRGIEVKNLRDLPRSDWMDLEISPFDMDFPCDPQKVICKRRYGGDIKGMWFERLSRGDIVPAHENIPMVFGGWELVKSVFGPGLFSKDVAPEMLGKVEEYMDAVSHSLPGIGYKTGLQ